METTKFLNGSACKLSFDKFTLVSLLFCPVPITDEEPSLLPRT